MRYGTVTRENVARMARRADSSKQLGLAALLYTIAGSMDPANPMGIPSTAITSDSIERGHAIDLGGDGRRRGGRAEDSEGKAVAHGA